MHLYFERYAHPKRYLEDSPMHPNTRMCIVIPSFAEESIDSCLTSLINARQPNHMVEVLVVINQSENDPLEIEKINERTKEILTDFKKTAPTWMRIHCIGPLKLEKKKAGVGLARKIGMDEAAFRFQKINYNGLIVCFDADSTVVSNYFQVLESNYLNMNFAGASIHYEHDIDGETALPIILYELQLRYYVLALAYSGYPYAYHTIGSSMAVSTDRYLKVGGMNTRKAGEDFYFLHKVIPLGNFVSVNKTTVYPSSRISSRVPFGTGRAMLNYMEDRDSLAFSYSFKSFETLKELLALVNNGEDLNNSVYFKNFLREAKLEIEFDNIQKQSRSENHFRDRFFLWFNGFKALKFIHFLRDNYFPNTPINLCVENLVEEVEKIPTIKTEKDGQKSYKDYLEILRNFEKST